MIPIPKKSIEYVLIVRGCAPKDMYDDGGYCDTKIRKNEPYYWLGVEDGNGETMCSECALQALLNQIKNGGRIPQYIDNWFTDMDIRSERTQT